MADIRTEEAAGAGGRRFPEAPVSGEFVLTPLNRLAPTALQRAARRATAAFAHRDFRLLWLGACVSSIGTWTQAVAENWLILSMTGSAFYLGIDAFLQQLPILLFTLIGGVVADRRDRRRMLLVSQYVQMSSALALATLVSSGIVEVWHILALSFLSGCAQAFGGPAYQAITPSLVGEAEVTNAIALNSLQFNIARVIGPALAGTTMLLLRKSGVADTSAIATCFALNGLSFVVVIVALLSLRVRHAGGVRSGGILEELRAGLSFVGSRRDLVAVVALSGLMAVIGYPIMTLLPLFARDLFGSGLEGYSALMVSAGAGAVAGTLLVAWLGSFPRMGRATLFAMSIFGSLLAAFALSSVAWLTCILLFFIGAGLMIVSSTLTSLAHLSVPDRMRGRAMSVYLVVSRGGMPLGSLLCGYLASITSAGSVLGAGGAILFLVSVAYLMRRCEM